jgi:PAS domain S-box-containing protein
MQFSLQNKVRYGFIPALLILLFVAAASYRSASKSAKTFSATAQTKRTRDTLEELLLALVDVETGNRGYVATGSEPFLEPYESGRLRAQTTLQNLRLLLRDDPRQQQHFKTLDPLVDREIAYSGHLIELRRTQGFQAASAVLAEGEGKRIMDETRQTIAKMETAESQILQIRMATAQGGANTTMSIVLAGGLLSVVFATIASLLLHRSAAEQKRLHEERDRFFSLSLDMLCIAKSDGYFKRLNPAFTETLGWSVEELLSRPFLDFVHPDDHAATLLEVGRQTAAGQCVLNFENRYRHKDGSWRVLSWKSAPQPDGMMFSSARDVTELRRIEDNLRRSEERFRLLVDGVKDYAILMLDPKGCVGSWNAGAQRIKGYEAHEIIGQHFSRFYPKEDAARGKPERELEVALAEGRFEEEGLRLRKDGSQFWANVVITPLRDAHGNLYGFGKVTRDVTDRRRADEALQHLNSDLKKQTSQLETANKELEAFSYSVSHDLRAPLRHIDGYVARLVKNSADKLDDRSRRCLKIISDAAREMGQLIDDLLLFSRIGQVEMVQTMVDLGKLVEEVTATVRPPESDRKISWKHGPLPIIPGDPALLKQVFVNLLSNAVKYTRPRNPACIETGVAGEPNGEVVLFVRDNGVGFEMEYVNKLFGVFQRLHRADEFEGTGIGLANVRRIVQRHGGRTWAEGQVDNGATFYFSLPTTRKAQS